MARIVWEPYLLNRPIPLFVSLQIAVVHSTCNRPSRLASSTFNCKGAEHISYLFTLSPKRLKRSSSRFRAASAPSLSVGCLYNPLSVGALYGALGVLVVLTTGGVGVFGLIIQKFPLLLSLRPPDVVAVTRSSPFLGQHISRSWSCGGSRTQPLTTMNLPVSREKSPLLCAMATPSPISAGKPNLRGSKNKGTAAAANDCSHGVRDGERIQEPRTLLRHTTKIQHSHSFRRIRSLNPRLSLILLAFMILILGVAARTDTGKRRVFGDRDVLKDDGRSGAADEEVELLVDIGVMKRSDSPVTSNVTPSSISTGPRGTTPGERVTLDDDPNDTPTAFDSVSLSGNMTIACSNFLSHVIKDSDFQGCLPLSGLLRDSVGFFNIMKKGPFVTTSMLDRMCTVNLNKCTQVMEEFGGQVRQEEYCGSDYELGNPIVTNMFSSLIAYRPLYSAGCLKAANGDYCFVDAVTSIESPEDLFIYSLPLGTYLPGGARPKCSDCLIRTMSIFNAVAGNKTQLLFNTYLPASEQLNIGCGPGYINDTVEMISAAAKTRLLFAYTTALVAVVLSQHFL